MAGAGFANPNWMRGDGKWLIAPLGGLQEADTEEHEDVQDRDLATVATPRAPSPARGRARARMVARSLAGRVRKALALYIPKT